MKPRLTVEERIALLALLLCLALIVLAAFCIASAQGATMTDTKAKVPALEAKRANLSQEILLLERAKSKRQ